LDVGIESGFDGVNHLNGAGLALGRESAVDVGLAQGIAEIAVGGADAAAPARLLFFSPGQRVCEEVEVFVDDGLVQKPRSAMNYLPAQVGLPVIERLLIE